VFLVSKKINKSFFDSFSYKEDFQHSILSEKNYSRLNTPKEFPYIESL